MRIARTMIAATAVLAVFFSTAFPAGGARSGNVTFVFKMGDVLAFIDNKQDPSAPTGLTSWQNTQNASAATDCVAVFRLVLNLDARITAPTQGILTHTESAETLATFWRADSDGDGQATSGFRTSQYGNGVNGFQYVGGGTTAWQTANGYTAGTFLSTGKRFYHVNDDGAGRLTITCRGWNGEDFGADSDNTEAPNLGTYTANLTLLAVDW